MKKAPRVCGVIVVCEQKGVEPACRQAPFCDKPEFLAEMKIINKLQRQKEKGSLGTNTVRIPFRLNINIIYFY